MPVVNPNHQDEMRRAVRALEFKHFRRDHLYSQNNLAEVLQCSRRTIVSIEGGVTVNPHPELLRKFRDLKRKHERTA